MIGQSLAHYEILELLGQGGMGEVYRARDTRLDREVALKLLHEEVSRDPERLARFRREAKLLASLSHPNISALHGIEEAQGRVFLVMELAPGEDLTALISRGPVPPEELTKIGAQIARGLEAAHERGIVHRDLKPSNVKLAPDGQVKILDFGLARVYADDESSSADIENSPTITAAFTAAGVILGTAAYMSPEQARGRPVDKRTDIWAFGVVLWEMLTGERLFAGETVSDTLAAVLTRQIDAVELPPATPAPLRLLLQRCLERDAKRRLRDIGEARLLLEDPDASSISLMAPVFAGTAPNRIAKIAPWLLALTFLATTLALALGKSTEEPAKVVRRFQIPTKMLQIYNSRAIEISPDGKNIVILSSDGLWLRPIDDTRMRLLVPSKEFDQNVSGATPFWSPDSREIAYGTRGRLWKIALDSASPVSICVLPGDWMGGAWDDEGYIVFSTTRGPMYRVPARGGDPQVVLEVDSEVELDFHQPSFIRAGGGGYLYSVHRAGRVDTIELLRDGVRKVLLRVDEETRGSVQLVNNPIYSPTGHIIYQRDQENRGLWALPFDAVQGEVTGEPFLVRAEEGYPSVSDDGTLLHATRIESDSGLLMLVSREGKVLQEITGELPLLNNPRYSPDGSKIVCSALRDQSRELLMIDLVRSNQSWLTYTSSDEFQPRWMPDGQRIVYAAPNGVDCTGIWTIRADGSGIAELISARGNQPFVGLGGKELIATTMCMTQRGIFRQSLEGPDQEPQILLEHPAGVDEPEISPDGRFILFRSWNSGAPVREVADYPSMTGRRHLNNYQIPAHWSKDGKSIYYMAADPFELHEVRLADGEGFEIAERRVVLDLDALDVLPYSDFDVSPDGSEFVLIRETAEARTADYFTVVENWFEEFRER